MTTKPQPLVPALRFDGVTVEVLDGRHRRTVVDAFTLEVYAGELVAVMGPSGSGKSTVVNVGCGLVTPTRGEVAVLGARPGPLVSLSPRWWAERRRSCVGVVHQRLNLLGGLSARENVALALDLQGRTHAEARREADAALERVGISSLANIVTDRLSVGEQQRVAIARAIAGDRPIVLADEPSAALDRTSADEVSRLLADLAHDGRAVLLVTHDSQQASWADRTLVVRDGRIVDHISAHPTAGSPTDLPQPGHDSTPLPSAGWS
ncbi:MAG: ATP-binding cassette domain-containing protein [Aquihabitans sp.]